MRNKQGMDTLVIALASLSTCESCVGEERQVRGDVCGLLGLCPYFGVERRVSKRLVLVMYCCLTDNSKAD